MIQAVHLLYCQAHHYIRALAKPYVSDLCVGSAVGLKMQAHAIC